MFQTDVVEKIYIHCTFNENRTVYEIMWIKYCRAGQATIWVTRIACWIPKATNTHSEYVLLIAFPLQQWLQERGSALRLSVHCLSCLLRSCYK
jgi:hypothetical protein